MPTASGRSRRKITRGVLIAWRTIDGAGAVGFGRSERHAVSDAEREDFIVAIVFIRFSRNHCWVEINHLLS